MATPVPTASSPAARPHRPPPPLHTIEHHRTDLEIKASVNEGAVDQLNVVIVRQPRQIVAPRAERATLRQQRPDDGTARALRSLRDGLPPHD